MGELIHDLAPGADLLFHLGFPDEATFAESITALRACGADILVDDVIFFAEPMFQDGIIAQAADAAVADGALRTSAAGNAGGFGIDQIYRDARPERRRGRPAERQRPARLRRRRSASPPSPSPRAAASAWCCSGTSPSRRPLGAGASTDLDLYLLRRPSTGRQRGHQQRRHARAAPADGARERRSAGDRSRPQRPGAPRTVYVAVDHVCGNEDLRLRIVRVLRSGCSLTSPLAFEPRPVRAPPTLRPSPPPPASRRWRRSIYREIDSDGEATPPAGRSSTSSRSAPAAARCRSTSTAPARRCPARRCCATSPSSPRRTAPTPPSSASTARSTTTAARTSSAPRPPRRTPPPWPP